MPTEMKTAWQGLCPDLSIAFCNTGQMEGDELEDTILGFYG